MGKNNYADPESLPSEGERGFTTLCGLARHLGYDTYPQQLYNNDGTTVSSLINMLQDNPGMIEAMYKWVAKNYSRDELEKGEKDEDEECDDDGEDEEKDESII